LWYAIYLAAHLLLYIAVLRQRPAFRQEKVIFAYHAMSAVGVTLAVLLEPLVTGTPYDLQWLQWVVAIVGLHGIYSTSFLELWSLAEGGYSLQILEELDRAERRGEPANVEALRAIGVAKQGDRLAGLSSIGLVRQQESRLELTGTGRLVGSVFALLAWLTNVKDGV
jgi:hypothetical protein